MADDPKKYENNEISEASIEIDDFLLEQNKTANKPRKNRHRSGPVVRGITTDGKSLWNKKILYIVLIALAGYGVVYLFSPSESYIDDPGFEDIEIEKNNINNSGNNQYDQANSPSNKSRKSFSPRRYKNRMNSLSERIKSRDAYQNRIREKRYNSDPRREKKTTTYNESEPKDKAYQRRRTTSKRRAERDRTDSRYDSKKDTQNDRREDVEFSERDGSESLNDEEVDDYEEASEDLNEEY